MSIEKFLHYTKNFLGNFFYSDDRKLVDSNDNKNIWPPVRPYPLVYFVEPSSICNAACIFCHYPQQKESGKPIKNIDEKDFYKAIELIYEDVAYRKVSKVGVSLTPTTEDVLVNKEWHKYITKLLQMPFADRVDLVTNAILLNQQNIEYLCNLPNIKNFDLGISIGGLDKDTYELMFGNDKFETVKKNVNNLLKELKARNIKMNVWLNFRVPEANDITEAKIAEIFNQAGYEWVTYTILDTFKDVPMDLPENIAVKLKKTDFLEPRDYKPCGMLVAGTINFNADGKVTACGCHYSQKPGDNSMLLANLNDQDISIEKLNNARKKLIDEWSKNNEIPEVCKKCQHYHQHEGIENIGLKFE